MGLFGAVTASYNRAQASEAHVGNEALHISCTVALGSLMDELNRNAHAYPFHHVDGKLLERAAAGLSKELAALEGEFNSEMHHPEG